MQAAYREIDYQNETAPILAEYATRKKLAELGYRFDPAGLDVYQAHCFSIIAAEIQKIEDDDLKKRN